MKPICFAKKKGILLTRSFPLRLHHVKHENAPSPRHFAEQRMIFHVSSKGTFPQDKTTHFASTAILAKLQKEHTAQKWSEILVVGFIVIILPPSLSSCEIDEGWDTSTVQSATGKCEKSYESNNVKPILTIAVPVTYSYKSGVQNKKLIGISSWHLATSCVSEIGETISPIEASATWNATRLCRDSISDVFKNGTAHLTNVVDFFRVV